MIYAVTTVREQRIRPPLNLSRRRLNNSREISAILQSRVNKRPSVFSGSPDRRVSRRSEFFRFRVRLRFFPAHLKARAEGEQRRSISAPSLRTLRPSFSGIRYLESRAASRRCRGIIFELQEIKRHDRVAALGNELARSSCSKHYVASTKRR